MKLLLKLVLLIVVIGLLSLLVFENQEYFLAVQAFTVDLKIHESLNWTIPGVPNLAFWGICFFIGLFLAGYKALSIRFRLNKQLRQKETMIRTLKDELNAIKTELDVFKHDPYIKPVYQSVITDEETQQPQNEEPVSKDA